MIGRNRLGPAFVAAAVALLLTAQPARHAFSQQQPEATDASANEADQSAPEPLSEDELEILVARVALYPDQLIALISGASIYPLQVVEAARFLEKYEKDKTLKPKESWDGSIISLLNYPEIVKMMSDDLEWTQQFGEALAYQQKDLLIAIQQLREEAVTKGIIKTDDKVEVVEENDNVIIRSADPEMIYVPQYEPEMLYVENYAPAPISYYPEPYQPYWYPGAAFFAGAVAGGIWGAVVDWDDWGVWGGRWDGGDIDVDCNNCFNNRDFNGKVNFGDVDWKNVDRSKINIDRDQLNKFDRGEIKDRVKANGDNAIRDRARDVQKGDKLANRVPGKGSGSKDVRNSVQQGLKAQAGQRPNAARPNDRPNVNRPANRPATANRDIQRSTKVDRPAGKPKPARKVDNRSKKPSGLGNPSRGKTTKVNSNRGQRSMSSNRGASMQRHGRPSGGGARGGGGGGRRR